MFERFTDRARRIVVLAQEIAREHNQPDIGTAALLAACIREGEGVAWQVLSRRVPEEAMLALLPRGEYPVRGHIPFTPDAKTALDRSLREALQLGHSYIGTEHLLLALVHDPDSPAARFLDAYGNPGWARAAVIEALSTGARPAEPLAPWTVTYTGQADIRHVAPGFVRARARAPLELDVADALAGLDTLEAALNATFEKATAEFRAAIAEARRRLNPPTESPAEEA